MTPIIKKGNTTNKNHSTVSGILLVRVNIILTITPIPPNHTNSQTILTQLIQILSNGYMVFSYFFTKI